MNKTIIAERVITKVIECVLDDQKLKIGDAVWFMQENKPVVYYVWNVLHSHRQIAQNEYGHAYDWKEVDKFNYHLQNDLKEIYQAKEIWLSDIPVWFRTKEELLKSL